MPVLKGEIDIPNKLSQKVKILIDSGAAISLISKDIAAELIQNGVRITSEGNLRIKVANGERTSLNETVKISIKVGGRRTDPINFCFEKFAL